MYQGLQMFILNLLYLLPSSSIYHFLVGRNDILKAEPN